MKKMFFVALALLLVLTMVPLTAQAAEVASGICGDNVTWVLDDNGTLTISGTGPMADYGYWPTAPWYDRRDEITNVVIGDGVTSIGVHAFASHGELLTVTIGSDVTSIGEKAFYSCGKLTRVVIPDSVKTIGNAAFSYCSGMTKLTIGSGVTEFDEHAFSNCSSLTALTIPDNVETIGASAFANCNNLKRLVIGNGVTTIEENTFSSCYNLTDLTLGSNIETIGKYAFAYCRSITGKLVIPNSVKTIGESAFSGCDGLVNVVIPNSVTSLGESAFSSCQNLRKVTLSKNLTKISSYTFKWCYALDHIVIPEGVTMIGEQAFANCSDLKSITLPDSIDMILSNAFYGYYEMEDVYFGGSQEQWEEISISQNNTILTDATVHFGSYAGDVIRVAGAHRWETALKVAEEMRVNLGVVKFDAIIVASGNDFADALAGSYLATVKNAPILLSWGKGGQYEYLDYDNIYYIQQKLAPGGTVYILGGKNAVPELYENNMSADYYGFRTQRLGGAHRFETNLMILEEAGVKEGDEVLVCTSTNFADSLSASATGKPILLVWNESGALFGDQPSYLAGLKNCTFTVVGGESAVSKKLETAISRYGKVSRLAGSNRFETSVKVAKACFDAPESVVMAYAWNYPDGLCGGGLAYSMNAPLVLTMTDYKTQAVDYANEEGILEGAVLGGTVLISDNAVRAIYTMAKSDWILVK